MANKRKGLYFRKMNLKTRVIKQAPGIAPDKIRTEAIVLSFFRKNPDLGVDFEYFPEKDKLVKEYVSGKSLKQFNRKVTEKLAEWLSNLHKCKFKWFGRIGFPKYPLIQGTFETAATYYCNLINQAARKKLTGENLQMVIRTVTNVRKAVLKKRMLFQSNSFSIIHRDLHKGNILLHEGKLQVIDWGSAAIWDPALDIALLFYKNAFGESLQEDFYKVYIHETQDTSITQRVNIYVTLVILADVLFNVYGRGESQIAQAYEKSLNLG